MGGAGSKEPWRHVPDSGAAGASLCSARPLARTSPVQSRVSLRAAGPRVGQERAGSGKLNAGLMTVMCFEPTRTAKGAACAARLCAETDFDLSSDRPVAGPARRGGPAAGSNHRTLPPMARPARSASRGDHARRARVEPSGQPTQRDARARHECPGRDVLGCTPCSTRNRRRTARAANSSRCNPPRTDSSPRRALALRAPGSPRRHPLDHEDTPSVADDFTPQGPKLPTAAPVLACRPPRPLSASASRWFQAMWRSGRARTRPVHRFSEVRNHVRPDRRGAVRYGPRPASTRRQGANC